MAITLNDIKKQVNPHQADLLSQIWRYRVSTDSWIPARVLHKSGGGKPLVRPLLSSLGGTVVYEMGESGTTKYALTLLGVLLSADGQRLKTLLTRYLTFVRLIALEDPERSQVHSTEVSKALGISGVDLADLGVLLFLDSFTSGGSYSPKEWSANFPRDIEDIPEDLSSYIDVTAIKNYDPVVPTSQIERLSYQSQVLSSGTIPTASIPGTLLAHTDITSPPIKVQQPPDTEEFGTHEMRIFDTALDTYTRISVLGEGGSGRVLLVQDSKGAKFAIKCLHPHLVSTLKIQRFRNELSFSQKNTHPNILTITDHGFLGEGEHKTPFYVMPYYPTTLRKQLVEGLDHGQAYEQFMEILDGVEAAHQRGIWHRDLKPENILVDPVHSWLVVADFGIAHFSEDDLHTAVQTKQAERLANFQYAAPEQRIRGRTVDAQADIYALGLILNELLTTEVPFGPGYKKISRVAPEFAYLDDVVDRMIQQNPSLRPSSIKEIKLEIASRQQRSSIPHSFAPSRASKGKEISAPETYRAEVDCVGRIDDLNQNTILSISAGLSYSILISPVEKEKALSQIGDAHPRWGRTRRHVLLYTLLLYLLIRDHMRKLDIIVIDTEYPGYNPQIKDMLLRLLRNSGIEVRRNQINLRRIDRSSPARLMASRVFKSTSDPDMLVGAKQIAEVLQRRRSGP